MSTEAKGKSRKRASRKTDEQETLVQIYQRPVQKPGEVWALIVSPGRQVRFHAFLTPLTIQVWRSHGWTIIEGRF